MAVQDVRKRGGHLYLTLIRTPQMPVDKATYRILWNVRSTSNCRLNARSAASVFNKGAVQLETAFLNKQTTLADAVNVVFT